MCAPQNFSRKLISFTLLVVSMLMIASCDQAKPRTDMTQPSSTTANLATEEPLGGQPPAGSKPSTADLGYDVVRQRAFETVLWSLPAVEIYRFRGAAFSDLGMKDTDIITYSHTATPKVEAITPNSSTPYIAAYVDLKQGPAVLDVPPAGPDGTLYGQVVDAWQFTIADVGPSGLDKGKGGKYLFTAPDYHGAIPSGYIHIASPNYRIAFAFRSIVMSGKSPTDAFHYAQRLRMYYLSDAAHPPQQHFVDPSDKRYPTLPFYDERYFKDVYDIFTYEPVKPENKAMIGKLASLGIVAGQPFHPDEAQTKAMRQGAIDAWNYLQQRFDHLPKQTFFWPDRHYVSLMQSDKHKTFSFDYPGSIDIDARALQYFWCTYVPKQLSDRPATQYMVAMADNNGDLLKPGVTYKVTVPPKMPVKQFWALTVYDRATFSFIYTASNRTTLSSYDLDKMKKNQDGSVTLYVGPTAPSGLDTNWIPTGGKRPMPTMRFYGPSDDFYTEAFRLPDFEVAK